MKLTYVSHGGYNGHVCSNIQKKRKKNWFRTRNTKYGFTAL